MIVRPGDGYNHPSQEVGRELQRLGAVTKMMADMICGPAFIVMARG